MKEILDRYIILDKERLEFYDGECTTSLLSEAVKYQEFEDANYEVKCMDEPEKYDILEITITYETGIKVKEQ